MSTKMILVLLTCATATSLCEVVAQSTFKQLIDQVDTENSIMTITNICRRPSRHVYRRGLARKPEAENLTILLENVFESMKALEKLIDETKNNYSKEEIRCNKTVSHLESINIADLIPAGNTSTVHELNPIVRIYTNLYQLVARLSLHSKLRYSDCCLTDVLSDFETRLRNRVLTKWFVLYRFSGRRIRRRHCLVRAKLRTPSSCSDIRDLMYVLLNHARIILNNNIEEADKLLIR